MITYNIIAKLFENEKLQQVCFYHCQDIFDDMQSHYDQIWR